MHDQPEKSRGLIYLKKGQVPAKAENYLTLQGLAKRTSYSTGHLRRLLQRGRISGVRVGNVWLATRSSVESYRKVTKGHSTNVKKK